MNGNYIVETEIIWYINGVNMELKWKCLLLSDWIWKEERLMNVEKLKERKKELGYSNEKIAEISGVPLSTVQKVFAGVTQQPRYDTLVALERALENINVRETVFQYGIDKEQGEYTIEDYEKIPEDVRVELIDGVFYVISSPSVVHQQLVFTLCQKLNSFIRENGGECIAMLSPMDVHLKSDDNKTMVQPDVFVVCDRKKFTKRRIEGAPDLVIEVVSESSKRKDVAVKLPKYDEAGVKEYWLVDPESKRVVVYVLGVDMIPNVYNFEDRIPVAIFDNECVIDMQEIYSDLQFFFGLE